MNIKVRVRLRVTMEVIHRAPGRNTPQRRQVIEEIAEREGNGFSAESIYRWVRKYEAENGGLFQLMTKRRSDRGAPKVIISQAWDRVADAHGVDQAARERILETALTLIRQAHQTVIGISTRGIQEHVLLDFMDVSREAGIALPDPELEAICLVPDRLVAQEAHHRNVCLYRRDKGQYAAKVEPRITRHTDDLQPMDVVQGDVQHMDILVRRPDGTLATPKAVAFLDLATRRYFIDVFLCEKGAAIRQEHVIQTLCKMLADANWGLPGKLVFDRGKEFNIDNALEKIGALGLTDRVDINRAKAHNPQSKGVIESRFNALKNLLKPYPGYIGGDRFRKPTPQLGRQPEPFPYEFETFRELFLSVVLEKHHKLKGSNGEPSPYERFNAFVEAGWRSQTVEFELSRHRAADRKLCHVRAGGKINIGGGWYRCDDIMYLAGNGQVQALVPRVGNRDEITVIHGTGAVAKAVRVASFGVDDLAGAHESTRQSRVARQQLRELEAMVPVLRTTRQMNSRRPDSLIAPTTNVEPLDPEYEAVRRARLAPESEAGAARRRRSRAHFDAKVALIDALLTGTDD